MKDVHDWYLPERPLPLPKHLSWPEAMHVFDERSRHALIAAEAAGRPLLIRGEPGTGKSQLARAAAVDRKRLFLSVVVNARYEAQDLHWRVDAVGRLAAAQRGADQTHLEPRSFLHPGPLWWAMDFASAQDQRKYVMAKGESVCEPEPEVPPKWEQADGAVLLIDEIDKADSDLANGLLEALGNLDFVLPFGIGSVRRRDATHAPPLVVVTTNEERELPAAFLRRCVVLPLALPGYGRDAALLKGFLISRGRVHFGDLCSEIVYQRAAELLATDRLRAQEAGLPQPGQAEYLDLLRAVTSITKEWGEQEQWLEKVATYILKKGNTEENDSSSAAQLDEQTS